MKRLTSILVAISLLFGLVGCSSVVDTTPPTTPGNITRTTPDNDNTPTFIWEPATDATSGIASYQVRIDSDAFTDIGNVTTYTVITALSDGSHTFEVRAVDEAGNEGTADSLAFTIDTTPAISLATLTVHFIDIGQGDSILVDFGDVEVLVDGGDKSPGVVSYIDDYVDGPLEVMVATHPHADHIGGLIDVLAAFEVQEIWHNGDTATSKTYSDFMSAVKAENAQVFQAVRGNTIEVDRLVLEVLHPVNLNDTTNNNSIVLYLAYGQIDFLFTGDAEKEAEATMLIKSDMPVPDVEILKVGHHGSNTASSSDFLTVTSPEVAIYMAGEGNRYGHPHTETISALCNVGAAIYGTDVHGNIVITTDSETYDLQLEKQAPPCKPYAVSPSPTPSTAIDVKITKVFYDGVVPRVESDEYVEITNLGSEPVDLKGWVLKDISEGYPSFTFPSYVLAPGESIRVYTDEVHPEWGGFSFGFGKAIWNNKDPDIAVLCNAQGQEVSRKSY